MMEFFSNRSNDADTSILLCLDEFASFGKLQITPALRKLRKKKVRILVLTQSIADIDLIYGKDERMSMMNNFAYKVVLGATDTETQDYFSKLIGEEEVKKVTISKGSANNSTSKTTELRRCVRPEELAHLGKYLILLSPKGWQRLKKKFYFQKW
jgi:type IV secretory pathway TraG/TraD family ATPase VirD4